MGDGAERDELVAGGEDGDPQAPPYADLADAEGGDQAQFGRAQAFGRIGAGGDAAWLFGLPGNPVAVMVTFYQFARPALLRLAGVETPGEAPELRALCTVSIRKGRGRTEFLRGVLYAEDGEWKVRTTGAQGSGILRSMTDANCFIVLGPEQGDVAAGDDVTVQILDGLV